MIRIEYSGASDRPKPPDSYQALLSLYEQFPDALKKYPEVSEIQPDARLLKLDDQKHGLILKLKKPSRLNPETRIAALVIENPQTPLSNHVASFCLECKGLLSLTLPYEHMFIDDQPVNPGRLTIFSEKSSLELAGPMTAWFLDMATSKEFISPPYIFIAKQELVHFPNQR